MGHVVFIILHILAILFGVVWLVITVPLHLIYIAIKKPKTLRPDGKPRTGGLFGGLIDDIVISSKMRDCPFCLMKIDKKAAKCPHCGEWVNKGNTPEASEERKITQKDIANLIARDRYKDGMF